MPSNYSGFTRRALARYIDTALVWLPTVIAFNYFFGKSSDLEELIANIARILAFALLPTLIISPIYSTAGVSHFKATIGKALVGLKVERENGNRLSIKRAFLRQTFGYLLSSSILGIGFLSMIKNPKKQTWHDEIVGSVVLKTHDLWFIGLAALFVLITVYIYFILQIIEGVGKISRIF